jgi:hypothetical protein
MNVWRKQISSALTVGLIGGMVCSAAHAVSVSPGQTVALPGTTLAAEPNLAGTVVLDDVYSFDQTFSSGTYVGSVQERVVRESGTGTLDFYWRVSNTGTPGVDANLGDFRIGDFNISAAPINLNYRIDGLGTTAPTSAERFSGIFQNYFNFGFADGIAPGQSSYFLLAETNATAFTQNASFDLTNVGESQVIFSGVQVSPAPEPETYAMMLAGLAVMSFLGYRRKLS